MSKNYQELKSLSSDELQSTLKDAKVSLASMKFDHAVNGLENPLVLRTMRKDVARILTEIRRREIDQKSSEEIAKRSKIRRRRK